MTGSIVSLQTCPGLREPMRPLVEAKLLRGGIPGDRHFAPESARQLLLIEAETLASDGGPETPEDPEKPEPVIPPAP